MTVPVAAVFIASSLPQFGIHVPLLLPRHRLLLEHPCEVLSSLSVTGYTRAACHLFFFASSSCDGARRRTLHSCPMTPAGASAGRLLTVSIASFINVHVPSRRKRRSRPWCSLLKCQSRLGRPETQIAYSDLLNCQCLYAGYPSIRCTGFPTVEPPAS